jgi:hypothetical protein
MAGTLRKNADEPTKKSVAPTRRPPRSLCFVNN